MTEKKLPLSKLCGPQIYNNVAKGIMTLRQLAEGYDCSYEQFLAECKRKISPFEWKRILKANSRNEKMEISRKEVEKMTERKPKQQHKAKSKQSLLDELAIIQEKANISRAVTEKYRTELTVAIKAEEGAQRALDDAQERLARVMTNLENSVADDTKYQERIQQIQAKLDEFNLYLIAPGYKGEIPRGRVVVVTLIDGHNVTVERGDDLLNDVSFETMLELGFETLKEANLALEFAKLVLKYQLECEEEFKILVDDERIITVLKGQEVDI